MDDEDVAKALRAGTREDLVAGYRSPDLWERARAAPLGGPALRTVAARAGTWASEGIPPLPLSLYRRFAEDGSRAPFEDVYFRARRNRLTDLALTALGQPDADLGPLEDLVWAVCDEYAWAVPAHLDRPLDPHPPVPHAEQIDLFAAETAFTLAELRHLFAGRLSPLVAERIRQEVARRVLRPILAHPAPWWESAQTNWAAVCAGSVGMAALHLLDDPDGTGDLIGGPDGTGPLGGPDGAGERAGDAAALVRITSRMIEAMRCFLAGYGEDGACPEGVAYWNYGFGFFTIYADGLHRRTGGLIDLFDDPTGKIGKIAGFPERVFLSGTATAAFSDSPPHSTVDPGLAAYLHRRFPAVELPPASRLETEPVNSMGSWARAVRSLVWADEPEPAPRAGGSGAPADAGCYFPDVQWIVARTCTAAGQHVGFAAKGGHNDELHNHNDVGSFVLAVDGEPLLAELGRGFYTGQYFGAGRYDVLCNGSQGHSVPLLDGTPQHASRAAAAEVLAVEQTAKRTLFRVDLSAAYAVDRLTSLVREFTYAGGTLTVQDRITAEAPVEITERFMSFASIVLDAPGRALIRGTTATMRLSYDAIVWKGTVHKHTHVQHDGTETTVHSLDLSCTSADADLTLQARPIPYKV